MTTARREAAPLDAVIETRWVFVLLCCYIASQAYTVPLVPVGPWPVWPGLPDIVFGALMVTWSFMKRPAAELSGARRTGVQVMFALTIVCVISYVISTILIANLDTISFGLHQQGPGFGLFEVARMVQFFLLFRVAACVPYTPFRLTVIRKVVTGAFLFICVTVLLTFFDIVPTSAFAPLLPRDQVTAGAWWHYVFNYDNFGLGTISYTHAYVAAQITLFLGLALHLRGGHAWAGNGFLIALGLAAALVTGSRAGLMGVVLIAGVFLLARSPRWLVNFVLVLALAGAAAFVYISSQPPVEGESGALGSIIDHQIDAFRPYEADNLVGRDEIWAGRIDNLNDHPWRWFTGWGFGSSPDTGPALSPHMLPLQIVMELGFGMLLVIALVCAKVLRDIWNRERLDRPFFWMTIALLVSSATQETFYPVPSTGYFLGFFLVALTIVLREGTDPVHAPETAAVPVTASRPAPGRAPEFSV
ncbi:MAG: O-antigen ligase family protein [Chloroflexia bacterium]|nr:O-antigen ligase family protein [Chloroflexia bacterium]